MGARKHTFAQGHFILLFTFFFSFIAFIHFFFGSGILFLDMKNLLFHFSGFVKFFCISPTFTYYTFSTPVALIDLAVHYYCWFVDKKVLSKSIFSAAVFLRYPSPFRLVSSVTFPLTSFVCYLANSLVNEKRIKTFIIFVFLFAGDFYFTPKHLSPNSIGV